MAGSGVSGLADVHAKIRACGDELKAWGDTRTIPEEEEIKSLQNRLDRINRDVTTNESKVGIWHLVNNWMIYCSNERFIGHKDLGLHG